MTENTPPPYQYSYLTAYDIASILNISRSFAYKLMQSGKLPVLAVGRSIRVRSADLHRFIEQNSTRPEPIADRGSQEMLGAAGDNDEPR